MLLIDGFGALRDEFEDLEDAVADLLKRGSGYGIHVVAGMLRWNDVRIATQSMFGTRVELRLNDPADSSIDRKLAETLSPDTPGRVLTDAKLFAQVALPRIDAHPAHGQPRRRPRRGRTHGPRHLARRTRPPVRVLPTHLPSTKLPSPTAEPSRIPIGLDQDALAPVHLDLFAHDQHLLILGDNECGKTNLLRLIARQLIDRYRTRNSSSPSSTPAADCAESSPSPTEAATPTTPRSAAALTTGIAKELDKRLPDETVDHDALADEPSFSGPRDRHPRRRLRHPHHRRPTAPGPLPAYVPSAQDIGLHFVIARRTAGSSRALYEPLLTTLRETGTAALVMTGDRTEGQLFPGLYASAQPPGRGTLVRRGRQHQLIQTALAPEAIPATAPDDAT